MTGKFLKSEFCVVCILLSALSSTAINLCLSSTASDRSLPATLPDPHISLNNTQYNFVSHRYRATQSYTKIIVELEKRQMKRQLQACRGGRGAQGMVTRWVTWYAWFDLKENSTDFTKFCTIKCLIKNNII